MKWLCTILFFITYSVTQGQVTFQKRFGGPTPGWMNSVAKTSDSGNVFAGAIGWGGAQDMCLLKTDSIGNLIWSKTYDVGFDEEANYIRATTDGGFIISGHTILTTIFDEYWFFLKTNSFGDSIWSRFYSGYYLSGGAGTYAQETSDGGYIAGGNFEDTINFTLDPFITKLDSLGNIIWCKCYVEEGDQGVSFVDETNDKGFIAFGSKDSLGNLPDAYVFKVDSNGAIVWSKSYGVLGQYDWAESGLQTQDGGYIILIETQTFGNTDACLVKIDSLGNETWSKIYGAPRHEWMSSISQTADKGYIVVGSSNSFSVDSVGEVYLMKLDSLGTLNWAKTYRDGIVGAGGNEVHQTNDGGYLIAGRSQTNGTTISYFIKTDSLGNSGCNEHAVQSTTQTINCDIHNYITADSILAPAPLGFPMTIGHPGSILTLCSSVDVPSPMENFESETDISPNPFHSIGTLHIKEELPLQNIRLEIFNQMGALVRIEEEAMGSGNQQEIKIERKNLAEGLYFYELTTTNYEYLGSGKFVIE